MRKTSKIFLVLFVSFFASYLTIKTIFLADTPNINPDLAKLFNNNSSLNNQAIAKEEIKSYTLANQDSDFIIYVYTINEKEIRIKIPKEKKPLSKEEVEKLYFPNK